jgi:4-amino-4-deoxy-L-arabinose transferase-like glycosyltransferase
MFIFLQINFFVSNLRKKYFIYFVAALSLITLLRLFLLNSFNLVPQEAYYWLYIQRPALSYFDHPPVCSYTFGLFTSIFGNTEFGVRFGMLLYSIGTSIFLFLLAKRFFHADKPAFFAYLFINLTIFFNLHSIVATPDAPLMFFWTASMFFFYKALFEEDSWRNWCLAGIFSGFALASKYTAAFIFFGVFLFLLLDKRWQNLFSPKFILSILLAMIVFSPVIIWNVQNGFASFLFQTSGRAKGIKSIGYNYFFQLIASQLYELTPLFFSLLIVILFKYLKRLGQLRREEIFLFSFAYPIAIFFFLLSFTTLVKMNWILPGYVAFVILSVNYYFNATDKVKKTINFLGIPTSVALILLNLAVILFPLFPIEKGDSWTGWKELAQKVITLKQEYDLRNRTFIFSNEYKIPAELAFYTPYKDVILAENVYGKKALQFDFWFDVHKFSGWDGIFIFSDYNPSVDLKEIERYFEKVEFVEEFKIIKRNKIFRKFYIYHCYSYHP